MLNSDPMIEEQIKFLKQFNFTLYKQNNKFYVIRRSYIFFKDKFQLIYENDKEIKLYSNLNKDNISVIQLISLLNYYFNVSHDFKCKIDFYKISNNSYRLPVSDVMLDYDFLLYNMSFPSSHNECAGGSDYSDCGSSDCSGSDGGGGGCD